MLKQKYSLTFFTVLLFFVLSSCVSISTNNLKNKEIYKGMVNHGAIFPHKIIITERILMKVVTPKLQKIPIPIETQENNENMK